MSERRPSLLISLLALLSIARPAAAGDCALSAPGLSTVPRCLVVTPDGTLPYTVRIVCSNGPVVSSRIDVRMTAVGDTLTCWCAPVSGPRPLGFTAVTNANGYASFFLRGGGCVPYGLAAIPGNVDYVAEVFADGVRMQECGLVSSDRNDGAGRPTVSLSGIWDPAGSCATSLSDAVAHTSPLATAQYDWCSDLNCDGLVTLSDATTLTPYLASSTTCAGNAGP